jgi:hypothetical protein
MFNSLAEHLDLLAGMIYLTDISYFCVNKKVQKLQDMVRMVFNAIFNNISVILWR